MIGTEIYQFRCAVCHGKKGAGDGPAADFLYPRPRDFTLGMFKYKTSPGELPARDQDLIKTIRHGLNGTAAEATLEIAAPALAAHLAHGDSEGACTAQQSDGCLALDVLVPDPQTDDTFYIMGIADLDFYPGELIEVDMTITVVDGEGQIVAGVVVQDSNSDTLDIDANEYITTGTVSFSVDYTVVEDDDADGALAVAVVEEGDTSFTLDAINFSCTAAP